MARRRLNGVVHFSPFVRIVFCPRELLPQEWNQALHDLDQMRLIRLVEVNGRIGYVCLPVKENREQQTS